MIKYTNIKKNEHLLNCPFCGSEAVIYDHVRDDGRIDGIGDVGCTKTVHGMAYAPCGAKKFHYSGKFGITKKEAIGAWNEYARRDKE